MTSCARNYSSTPGASSTRIAFGLQSYKLFFIIVLQKAKISCILYTKLALSHNVSAFAMCL